MLQALFHAWERRLASVSTDRIVRPFEWGLDWMSAHAPAASQPAETIQDWVSGVMADTDAFFTPAPTTEYTIHPREVSGEQLLTFPSALHTPHVENNTVYARLFPARHSADRAHRPAVLVLPQWNADEGGHVGLCKLLTMNGLTALRLSLP